MKNDTQSTKNNSADQPTGDFSLAARLVLIAALASLIITIVARTIVRESDGGLANVLTLILAFVTWLMTVLGLLLSPWPRSAWQIVAATPFLVIGLVLAMFRVTRLDGELVPQFESRWQAKAALPQAEEKLATQAEIIPAAARTVSRNDFPQFLGPQRSGILEGVQLDSNWNTRPPEVLWKQPIGAGWSGFAVQGDVAVTMEQRDQEQWISAYDVPTGKLYWHLALPGSHFNVMGGAGPRATPAIADDKVFAQSATGQVACVELATGQLVWQCNLLEVGGWDQASSEAAISWGRSGSPLVIDSLVVVPLGGPSGTADRSLIAFDKTTGTVRWRAGDDQIGYSSPDVTQLLDKRMIVIVNEATVTGHEIDSGKVLWTIPWDGHSNSSANCSQTITVSPTQMLITKGYSQGAKLIEFSSNDQGEWLTKTIWESSNVLKTKFTSAVRLGDYAFGLSDGLLECTEITNGKRQWKGRGYGHGQLLLVGDKLLVMAEQGDVALVATDAKQFKQLARFPGLSGVTWNVPSLSGDRLLIRNADEAACLKLPVK